MHECARENYTQKEKNTHILKMSVIKNFRQLLQLKTFAACLPRVMTRLGGFRGLKTWQVVSHICIKLFCDTTRK